jgi:hypothetical protein
LKAAGATTLGSTLTVSNNGSFGATLKAANGAATIRVAQPLLEATQKSTVRLTVSSNGSFGGTLEAKGATTLGSTLTVSSNGSFGGTLEAKGATTLGSTLTVSSNGSFGGTLQAAGCRLPQPLLGSTEVDCIQ